MRPGAGLLVAALGLVACRPGATDHRRALNRSGSPRATTTSPPTTLPAPTVPPAPPSAMCPPVPPRAAPWPTRPRYRLRVDVRPSDSLVDGELDVRFTPDRDTDRLVFRLWANGPRPASGGAHIDAGPVTVDGRPVAATLDNPTTMVVPLGRVLAAGSTVDASMPWQLRLPGPLDDRISRNGDSVRLGSFFPILPWEPGVGWALDPPTAGFAEAATSPVADFSVAVTVPAGLDVLASGVGDGSGQWSAAAMRDFALSVGRFKLARAVAHVPDAVDVTVGVDAALGVAPQTFLDKAVRVLEDFSRRFGTYPWPSYTLAVTPGLGGGIEYPSHVMQGPGTQGRTTSHEIGHQWFYGLVGNDQGRDPWLDEGLATYAEWREEGVLAAMRSLPVPAVGRGRVGEPMTFWEPRQSVYFAAVYQQGAQALAALGDPDLVDCVLRVYAAVNAHRVARPADLVAAAGAVFPDATATLAPFGVRP